MHIEDRIPDHPTLKGFQLIKPLGSGGAGSVFLAVQQNTGQLVALKILHSGQENLNRKFERFEREIRLCAQLHHPHIVKVLDKGRTEENRLFAAFEYVPGQTLKDRIMNKGALSVPKAAELMGQVLDALACAHDRGIIHRDLKPNNIMVTQTGIRDHVKVLDFGISMFLPEAQRPDYKSLTITQETLGTPSYSAPEQLRGEPPSPGSDIYAWGLIFIECLTGRPVMQGATLAEIFHRQLSPREITLPKAIVGHPLADLLRRVLKKKQNERAGQAGLLCSDLQKLNLGDIVGDLSDSLGYHSVNTDTIETRSGLRYERRQITVLCCGLDLASVGRTEPELEALEALQNDLLGMCADIGARFGGYLAGSLGSHLMIYFGYPRVSDNDARLGARAALEIAGESCRRNALLTAQHNIRLKLRLGMHTGTVVVKKDEPPSGLTPNIALRLESLARSGTILVSDTTRRSLERYIEFEQSKPHLVKSDTQPMQTFLLTGERQTEAFSFLTAGSMRHPMAGRDPELNTLREILHNAGGNRGKTAIIIGEAGIGKSRLVYEMHRLTMNRNFRSHVCRCLPEYRNQALYPVFEMLKSRLRLRKAASGKIAAGRLEAALEACDADPALAMPILCSWLSLPFTEKYPPIRHSPERQKQILFEVIESLVLNVAGSDPFLLVVEDLHWADPTSLELLGKIVDRIPGTSVMMILTARPEFSVPWQTDNFDLITLLRLSPKHARTMIQRIAGDEPIKKKALARISEHTGGIPLFIEEFTRMLLDMNYLSVHDGNYDLNDQFDCASVPVTLQGLLDERLTKLGHAKETIQIAAAIGKDFDYSLLVGISLRDEALVQSDLEQIEAASLIYKQRRVNGESYVFRHALILDAAYSGMPKSAREKAHLRIAGTLENEYPNRVKENPAVVAHHYAMAGMYERAVDYGSRAAKIYLERSLNDESIVHAEKALRWVENITPENRPRAKLGITNILTLSMMGKYGWADSRVKDVADAAKVLTSHMDQDEAVFPTLWSLATYHHVASNRKEVRELTNELAKIAGDSGDQGLQTAAATFLGLRYQTDGQYIQAAEALEQAIGLYNPELHKNHAMIFGLDTRVWAAGTLAIVRWFSGYHTVAVDCGENAVAWARRLNHIPSLGIALLYKGLLLYHEGDKNAVSDVTNELLAIAKKYGLPAFEGYATVLHCWTTGDAELAMEILNTLRQMGCKLALSLYGAMLADIQAGKGALDTAIARIDECLSLCSENDEHLHEPVLYKQRAQYLLEKEPDNKTGVRTSLMQAATCARTQGMLRIEGEAVFQLLRLFGPDTGNEKRLAVILSRRPEIPARMQECVTR